MKRGLKYPLFFFCYINYRLMRKSLQNELFCLPTRLCHNVYNFIIYIEEVSLLNYPFINLISHFLDLHLYSQSLSLIRSLQVQGFSRMEQVVSLMYSCLKQRSFTPTAEAPSDFQSSTSMSDTL